MCSTNPINMSPTRVKKPEKTRKNLPKVNHHGSNALRDQFWTSHSSKTCNNPKITLITQNNWKKPGRQEFTPHVYDHFSARISLFPQGEGGSWARYSRVEVENIL